MGDSSSSWKLEVKNTFVHMGDSSDELSCPSFTRSKSEPNLQASSSLIQTCLETPPLPLSRSKEASVGSVLHGSGACRACTWFWKPQGCVNGADCRHCHLCPQEALKRRRKANQVSRRRKERGASVPQSVLAGDLQN